jgi:hypothetical protein
VHGFFELPFAADPEIGFAVGAEASGWFSSLLGDCLHNQSVHQRCQRPFIESLRVGKVRHGKTDVIDHDALQDMQRGSDDRAGGGLSRRAGMLDEPQSSPSPRLRERDGVRDRCH